MNDALIDILNVMMELNYEVTFRSSSRYQNDTSVLIRVIKRDRDTKQLITEHTAEVFNDHVSNSLEILMKEIQRESGDLPGQNFGWFKSASRIEEVEKIADNLRFREAHLDQVIIDEITPQIKAMAEAIVSRCDREY